MDKKIRLSKIFESGKAVICPLDDSLISGPEGGLRDIETTLEKIVDGKPNAVLGFRGLYKTYRTLLGNTPYILNLTASTIRSSHTRKAMISQVRHADHINVDAVAVHVNFTSKFEELMLENLEIAANDCYLYQIPLLVMAYPRKEKSDGTDDNYEELQKNPTEYADLVAQVSKIAVDMGADIVKTQYTGSPESFRKVINVCEGTPVIMAGGSKISTEDMLNKVYGAMQAGASGCCIGRNVFNAVDPCQMVQYLRRIVHENKTVKQAMIQFT